ATVPNLPLIKSLHTKMVNMTKSTVAGTMASWNFANSLTLNTFAFGMYQRNPKRYKDSTTFLNELGQKYFGLEDTTTLIAGWDKFDSSFASYPFSIPFVYFGPVNDGPAHILSLQYKAKEYGPSWLAHKPDGDN